MERNDGTFTFGGMWVSPADKSMENNTGGPEVALYRDEGRGRVQRD